MYSDNELVMCKKFGFIFFLCYEGEDDKKKEEKKEEDKKEPEKAFTQEDVNRLLAADRRKSEEKLKKTIDELEAQKAKSSLTATERVELDTTIENLKSTMMTDKELTEKASAKSKKAHTEEITKISESRDQWQTLYTDSTIERAIVDASSSGPNKAFNASQVVAILRPNTRLVEALNSDGEKTGDLVPMVKFQDVDKDGKPVTLDLAVPAAVKRMRELDQFLNLFEGDGPGGMGSTNKGGGKADEDITKLAKGDAGIYRAARKAGKVSIG